MSKRPRHDWHLKNASNKKLARMNSDNPSCKQKTWITDLLDKTSDTMNEHLFENRKRLFECLDVWIVICSFLHAQHMTDLSCTSKEVHTIVQRHYYKSLNINRLLYVAVQNEKNSLAHRLLELDGIDVNYGSESRLESIGIRWCTFYAANEPNIVERIIRHESFDVSLYYKDCIRKRYMTKLEILLSNPLLLSKCQNVEIDDLNTISAEVYYLLVKYNVRLSAKALYAVAAGALSCRRETFTELDLLLQLLKHDNFEVGFNDYLLIEIIVQYRRWCCLKVVMSKDKRVLDVAIEYACSTNDHDAIDVLCKDLDRHSRFRYALYAAKKGSMNVMCKLFGNQTKSCPNVLAKQLSQEDWKFLERWETFLKSNPDIKQEQMGLIFYAMSIGDNFAAYRPE